MNYQIGDKIKFKTSQTKSEEYGPWAMGEIDGVLENENCYLVRVSVGIRKTQVVKVPEADIAGPADFREK